MPPGRMWPKRRHANPVSRRHRITVSFGDPITPTGDTSALIESVQQFFNDGKAGQAVPVAVPAQQAKRAAS